MRKVNFPIRRSAIVYVDLSHNSIKVIRWDAGCGSVWIKKRDNVGPCSMLRVIRVSAKILERDSSRAKWGHGEFVFYWGDNIPWIFDVALEI